MTPVNESSRNSTLGDITAEIGQLSVLMVEIKGQTGTIEEFMFGPRVEGKSEDPPAPAVSGFKDKTLRELRDLRERLQQHNARLNEIRLTCSQLEETP